MDQRPPWRDSDRLHSREHLRTCLLHRLTIAAFLLTFLSAASAQAPSTPGKPLPPGPMKNKITATCTQCHNTTRITEQHLTRQEWSDKLDKMEGLGAVIPDADRIAYLAYLSKHFGPSKGAGKKTAKKSAGGAD
jgi:hypothetical protein